MDNAMRPRLSLARVMMVAAGMILPGAAAQAAESATGAYVLGIRGPGAGITPPPGLFFSQQVWSYRGKISGTIPFDGGVLAADGRVKALVAIPTFVWVTPLELFGGRVGLSLTAPFGAIDVLGRIGPLRLKDAVTTFADPSLGGFIGWSAGSWHWQLGATGFLPIGDYTKGALANVAKHRAAIDLYAALTWTEPSWGFDVSNTVGVTFNRANEATSYRTGTELHWEWAITKKFENGLSFGPAGYVYQQLGGDSGPGARLGPFKGRVWALGAGVGYEFKAGPVPVTVRLRYFREMEADKRLRGDSAFLGVSFPLWVPESSRPR
jgi:hypothetical protein